MRTFSISIDIAAPPERVWEVMYDVERWHEWTPSITRATLRSGPPMVVGSLVVIRQPKFPPAIWSVKDLQPGRSFTWVSPAPGLRVVGTHTVEPVPGGSRATLSLTMRGIFGWFWGRLTRDITRRYIGLEAEGLKKRSENPGYCLPTSHASARG